MVTWSYSITTAWAKVNWLSDCNILKFGKCLLWQSDICEMEPSPCPVCRRTILRRFFGRQVNIFWNCLKMERVQGPGRHIPSLLSTIYYPPDQLYGPHCWSWEGGKTRHLPSFLEMGRNNFWDFLKPHVRLFRVIKNTRCDIVAHKNLKSSWWADKEYYF